MKIKKKISAIVLFLLILVSGIFWFSPEQPLKPGMLIVTAVPTEIDLALDDLGVDERYIPQARIIALDIYKDRKETFILTEPFYSARAPEVSYDGKELVFSGQKEKNEEWQIYVKDLQTLQVRQITHFPENCTDPAWLPDGRIAFSRLKEEEGVGKIHVLYACNPDGTNLERLTFHPNTTIVPSVVNDGRIILLSEQKYPVKGRKQMYAIRTDGTKSELFYRGDNQSVPVSRAWESMNNRLYLIEKDPGNQGGTNLVYIDLGQPLGSRENLSPDDQGSYYSVFPEAKERLLVSYRFKGNRNYGVYEFDIKTKKISKEIFVSEDFHLIEPVVIRDRALPMKLPPIVDSSKERGTLLCHDTDLSEIQVSGETEAETETFKVQVFGINKMLGEVPVEKDGSFYIEIDADSPVRFQTVNERGEILRGPSAWIWVRPNERRSCIGCHEDRELAPENKIPDALYNGMVSLPEYNKAESIVLSDN